MKVASLFSGIGGIDLGFLQAGFDIVWANEYNHDAAETYRFNFNPDILVEQDIRKVSAKLIPDFDVLVAGFPCQPFSIMGKQRGFADPRGNLFFEIARIVDVKRPRVIFLENVENLVNHDSGKTFLVIYNTRRNMETFRKGGIAYLLLHFWIIMIAMHLNFRIQFR